MKLTTKGKKRQAAIANALKKGLPLAGLLSSLMVTTGCDSVKGIMNRYTAWREEKRIKKEAEHRLMGDIGPDYPIVKPSTVHNDKKDYD